MYDIDQLEQSWKRYRRKFYLKVAGGLLGGLIAVSALIYIGGTFSASSAQSKKGSHPLSTDTNGSRSVSKKTPLPKETASAKSTQNVPESISQPLVEKPLEPTVPSLNQSSLQKRPAPPEKKPKMTIVVSDKSGAAVSSSHARSPKVQLKVTEVKSKKVVKQIEERFHVARDYDDAIYLAKYYYQKRRYKKAEYWAMQANTIDSTQEESWMIFAKAKAKRGRRAEALKVLQAYYDRSGSARVKDLIDRIRKGRSY